MTREGIMPLSDKIEAIKNIFVPTTNLGLIVYYSNMWKHRSDISMLLSTMTSKQAKWN